MREAIAVVVMLVMIGCSPDPEDPRDPKTPLPKTDVIHGPVNVAPLQEAKDEGQPQVLRAILRCRSDASGRILCALDAPRSRPRTG